MRILLWVVLLLCVFGAVSLYHSNFTSEARDQRAAAHAAAEAGRPLPSGFDARVIVGEKSGAPIVEGQRPTEIAPPRNAPAPKPKAAEKPKAAPATTLATTTAHVVKRGESLSSISSKYYGTSRPEVVQALAKFNQLKNVNALSEGQKLTIPPLASLGVAAK